jgi:hypothetical protein
MELMMQSEVRTFGLIAILATLLAANAAATAEPSVEYQVKAAYLSKFGNFVQWPSAGESSQEKQAFICIYGKDPFGDALDQAVRGRRIGQRDIAIRRIDRDTAKEVDGCQILYTGETNAEQLGEILKAVHGKDVLTVSEARDGPEAAPIIRFLIQNNSVRFEIDERAATENGLVISSQLLALAASVKTGK